MVEGANRRLSSSVGGKRATTSWYYVPLERDEQLRTPALQRQAPNPVCAFPLPRVDVSDLARSPTKRKCEPFLRCRCKPCPSRPASCVGNIVAEQSVASQRAKQIWTFVSRRARLAPRHREGPSPASMPPRHLQMPEPGEARPPPPADEDEALAIETSGRRKAVAPWPSAASGRGCFAALARRLTIPRAARLMRPCVIASIERGNQGTAIARRRARDRFERRELAPPPPPPRHRLGLSVAVHHAVGRQSREPRAIGRSTASLVRRGAIFEYTKPPRRSQPRNGTDLLLVRC